VAYLQNVAVFEKQVVSR